MHKALIIGCGKIAGSGSSADVETHAGAMKAEYRLTLTACVDQEIQKAKRFANQYQCQAYDDLDIALNESSADLVSICTPDATHFPIAQAVLESSSPPRVIFLEKPACTTEGEYRILKELANYHGVLVTVNHTRRFSPKYRALRDMLHSGQLGPVYRVNATYYSGWFHNGTHIVDTLAYLLADRIELEQVDDVIPSPYPGDPTLELTGRMLKSQAKVVISAIDEVHYQLFDFDFWCHAGRLRIENFGDRNRLEKRVVNAIGERVVESVDIELPTSERTEMQIALGQICDYLDSGDSKILNLVSLEAIETTMTILWQGRDLYNQHCRK